MAFPPPTPYEDPSAAYDEKFAFGFKGLQAQFFYLFCHFLFYGILVQPVASLIYNWLKKHEKFTQYEKLNKQMFLSQFKVSFSQEVAAWMGAQLVSICLIQHVIGASLCVPAVFPGVANYLGISPALAVFMVKQGAMCEAGWELSDTVYRIFQKWVQGRHDLQPNSLMVLCFIHHSMGMCMVVPMCAFDGGNPYFHETVFLLQGAAGIALGTQQAGFLLDIRESCDLLKMKAISLFTFLCMIWSRGIRYLMILYAMVTYYRAFEMYNWVYACIFFASIMGLLNILFIVDATSRALKYLPMTTADAIKDHAS